MTWAKEILRREAHHRELHEVGMCNCEEVHTQLERQRAREKAAERKKAKRKAKPNATDSWDGTSYGTAPQQSAASSWDVVSYGTEPQQQGWENRNGGYYPQANRQWKNGTLEPYQQENEELKNGKQQEKFTYNSQGNQFFEPRDFIPNTQQGLCPAS